MINLEIQAPPYFGDETEGKKEFDEPLVPLLVKEENGARIVLGTHDLLDYSASNLLVERRPGGWAIALHRGGAAIGYVFFLDGGGSFFLHERPITLKVITDTKTERAVHYILNRQPTNDEETHENQPG